MNIVCGDFEEAGRSNPKANPVFHGRKWFRPRGCSAFFTARTFFRDLRVADIISPVLISGPVYFEAASPLMKKFFLYIGIIFGTLLVLYLGIGYWLLRSTTIRVEASRQAILDRGDPLYLTDYETARIPDEENAYYYLSLAAADLMAFESDWEAAEIEYERRLSPEQARLLTVAVEKYGPMLTLLEKAAACEKYNAGLDYSKGIAMEMPFSEYFLNAARALSARALVAAYDGKGNEAIEQCAMSLRLVSHLREEPTLITYLVNLFCKYHAVLTANHVLRVADTTEEARTEIENELASIDNRQSRLIGVKGERAMGVQAFKQLCDGAWTEEFTGRKRFNIYRDTWLGAAYLNDDEAKFLEVFDRLIESLELSKRERDDAVTWVSGELSGFRYSHSRDLAPAALGRTVLVTDQTEARIRCLRLLLKIHGKPAVEIDDVDLPDQARKDPFTNKPLLIRAADGEWKVYSVGGNLRDDGGHIYDSSSEPPDAGLGPLLPPVDAEEP